jgi:hypothetical protein
MANELVIGGYDVGAAGMVWTDREIPRFGGERTVSASVPGSRGRVIRLGSTTDAEYLTITGFIRSTATPRTHVNLLANIDTLTSKLQGEKTIRFADFTDREWVGRLQMDRSNINRVAPGAKTIREGVVLGFLLSYAAARAQADTVVVGANPVLALGTAPSSLNVRVQNGAGATITRVVVQVRAAATVLRSLQWDGVVASAGLLEISADPFFVKNAGANAIDGLTAASVFPIAIPDDAPDNLLVTVTGGTGIVVTTTYRKWWW